MRTTKNLGEHPQQRIVERMAMGCRRHYDGNEASFVALARHHLHQQQQQPQHSILFANLLAKIIISSVVFICFYIKKILANSLE